MSFSSDYAAYWIIDALMYINNNNVYYYYSVVITITHLLESSKLKWADIPCPSQPAWSASYDSWNLLINMDYYNQVYSMRQAYLLNYCSSIEAVTKMYM